jgi:hypothetical protein
MTTTFREIQFSDSDIVNPDEYDTARPSADGKPSRYGMKLYLLHDHGFVIALAFAHCESDALDEMVDAGKLDSFQVREDEHPPESPEWDNYVCAGNASEFFDLSGLDCNSLIEVPIPPLSICALVNANDGLA